MAVLSDANREAVRNELIAAFDAPHGCAKADIRAAVNALDNYLDTNAATINQTLPEPAKTNLTQAQKAQVLAYVALKRYGVL